MSSDRETETCDRCNAVIVLGRMEARPPMFEFTRRTDDTDTKTPTYESTTRILCESCKESMLEWIDSSLVDRHDAVDLPDGIKSAEALEHAAKTLEVTAETLRKELNTDDRD